MEIDKFINIEAEQSILGAIILNNFFFEKVADLIKVEYFFEEDHKKIWNRLQQEIVTNAVISNQVTLKNYFENNIDLGAPYLSQLLIRASAVVDIRYYAKVISDLWQKRELLKLMKKTEESLLGESFASVSADLENELIGLSIQEARKKTQTTAEILDEMDSEVLINDFVPTGFKKLDGLLNGGIYKQQLCIIGARPSVGKAQPLDADILTLKGWKKMGDIIIGEELASIDGKKSFVENIFPQGEKQIFKVIFKDGRFVECCDEHLWRASYRHWDTPRIISTKRLIEMLKCKRYKNRIWIDEFKGDFGKEVNLPIDPWVLGVLIGDGGLSGGGIKFTNSSIEIIDKLQEKLGNKFIVHKISPSSIIDYSIIQSDPCNRKGLSGVRPNDLKEDLKLLGLMGCRSFEKFIPQIYLDSKREIRLELIRGLLDTDGYVSKSGTIIYSTSSEKLANQFVYLAQSLGANTYLSTKIPFYTYKGQRMQGRLHYRINLSYSDGFEFLTFSKKKERLKQIKPINKRNTIESIEYICKKPAQCIKVSHPSSLYITNNFIPTHNTSIAQNIILNASKEGKKCLFISLEVDKRNVVLKFLSTLSSVPFWKISRDRMSQVEQEFYLKAKAQLKQFAIPIDDSSYLTVSQVGRIIKNRIDKQPIDLVVVDYIQIIRGDDVKGKNEALIIKENTTLLKSFAKRFNVAVLALAQINRKAVEGAKQEPTINDFKGSGGIEEDADVAIILHRDRNENGEEGYFSNAGKLIVAKNRHGMTGEVGIKFDGDHSKFIELGGL